ncbi:uncharacterized protein GGS22DRAFT_173257 [Annulohypoxylon maeteangense]|uniref:uncharacterized protein n=1 Tax=Annulohypoxylon maeteangense TaxID=1927788 RepID=UPI002008981E|nr:uncharacterized protein GGS22DRAFT_173257 [Annulohypoxylon maeteangense]KAI0881065.1 hypothetical protein GGS22DRAFT_173257 [Annulohypoxylon maeteangense]
MASPQPPPQPAAPPQPQPQSPQADQYNNSNPYIHNIALGVTPIALFALFLPPRRMDLRFVILGGVTLWGTNQLVHDYTGTSTLHRFTQRIAVLTGTELSEKAKETQMRLRLERAQRKLREIREAEVPAEQRRLVEQQRQRKEEEERGLLKRVWMGDSPDDWKEKRDRKEKEALREGGGGYWGLIVDQISEVWSGGKKKDEEEKTTEKGSAEDKSKKS